MKIILLMAAIPDNDITNGCTGNNGQLDNGRLLLKTVKPYIENKIIDTYLF
jgi:hypothetical protein